MGLELKHWVATATAYPGNVREYRMLCTCGHAWSEPSRPATIACPTRASVAA